MKNYVSTFMYYKHSELEIRERNSPEFHSWGGVGSWICVDFWFKKSENKMKKYFSSKICYLQNCLTPFIKPCLRLGFITILCLKFRAQLQYTNYYFVKIKILIFQSTFPEWRTLRDDKVWPLDASQFKFKYLIDR